MELIFSDNSFTSKNTHSTLPKDFFLSSLSSTEKQVYLVTKEGTLYYFSRIQNLTPMNNPYRVTSLSCGRAHTCILTDTLEVFSWGNGESGALGLGTTQSHTEPQRINISSDNIISQISCGAWHTLLLSRYQTGNKFILGMGRNSEGQLGTGKFYRELLPCKVILLEDVNKISCGTNHSLILGESKSIYATGDNRFGQLGLGNKRNTSIFTRIDLEGVDDIACGHHSAALVNSKIYVWGTATFGEFLSPVIINGPRIAKNLKVGDCIGCVFDENNKLWVWGSKNSEKTLIPLDINPIALSINSGINIYALLSENTPSSNYEKISTNRYNNRSFSPFKNNSPGLLNTKKRSHLHTVDLEKKSLNSEAFLREKYKPVHDSNISEEKIQELEEKIKKELYQKIYEEVENKFKQDLNEILIKNQESDVIKEEILNKNQNLYDENKNLFEDYSRIKESLKKISSENERLLKSFHSDHEIKLFYENLLTNFEKEKNKHIEKQEFENITLRRENENIQELLVSLREENLLISEEQKKYHGIISQLEQKLSKSNQIITMLESKISTLQEQLSDITKANHELYENLEKSNEKNYEDLMLQQSLGFKESVNKDEDLDEDHLDYNEEVNVNINRKGLSSHHQEKLLKAAAENMKYEDLDEFRSISPLSPKQFLVNKKQKKDSFEDVRNKVKNLKKNRSIAQSHMFEFERRFNK